MSERIARIPSALAGTLLLAATPAWAIDDRWSVSFALGGHLPSLGHLDDGLAHSAFQGSATVLVQEGTIGGGLDGEDSNETEVIPFRYENQLGPVRFAPQGAVEIAWHANERNSFIIGFGAMEHVSSNATVGNIPLQQYFVSNIVDSERRGKISFTEFTLGWRHTFLSRESFRFYTRASIHEVFDIDYREEWTFLFTASPIADLVGVRRNMVAEAESASLFMGQVGLGAEWFLNDWFSLSLEGGYLIGQQDIALREVELRDDFNAGDAINRLGVPFRTMPDGTLGFQNPGVTVDDLQDPATRDSFYTPIRLSFDGWRIGMKFSLYF